ncbi:MAG: hypothetical protein R3E84_23190 [Pseudomonadales bacterium]
MSKYALAKEAIAQAMAGAERTGIGQDDVLLALIVPAVADYQKLAGKAATRSALRYELDNLGGDIDTVFLRSR